MEAEEILRREQEHTQARYLDGERAGVPSDSSPRDADTIASSATAKNSVEPLSARVLSALHRRELELGSPVAILDDKMARVRPASLLVGPASVSVNALVTPSYSLANAVVGDSNRVGGLMTAAAHTAPLDRYRHGQCRRQLSLPTVPVVVGDEGQEGAVGEQNVECRPWTTLCHGGDRSAWAGGNEGGSGDGGPEGPGGLNELEPLRYGSGRLAAAVVGYRVDCMQSQLTFCF